MNEDLNSTSKVWLVKSSTRILGPYSMDEVVQLLKNRQISVIDEIAQSEGRWSYIREHKLFIEVVKSVRDVQEAQSDETKTHSVAHMTITKSDVVEAREGEYDLTPPPLIDVNSKLKDVTHTGVGSGAKETGGRSSVKSFGVRSDARVLQKAQKRTEVFRWFLLSFAIVLAVSFYASRVIQSRRNSENYEVYVNQAIRYKKINLYQKSLAAYFKAAKLKEPNNELKLQMAPLLISEERRTLEGRRILEKAILNESQMRSDLVEAFLGIAVSYLLDGDLTQAEETLQKISPIDTYNVSALLNLAMIEYRKGKFESAAEQFLEVYKKNPVIKLSFYGYALSSLEQLSLHPNLGVVKKIIGEIERNLQEGDYLKQELMLLLVYSDFLAGDFEAQTKHIRSFINLPVWLTSKFVHPLTVDWRFIDWEPLEKMCFEIYRKHSDKVEVKSLRAICLMQINRNDEAAKIIDEALLQHPKDPFILATRAQYLFKMGRNTEVQSVLDMEGMIALPIRMSLKGEVCLQQQDLNCAESAFGEMSRYAIRGALSSYGLSWVAYKKKDHTGAYNIVNEALKIDAEYVPLLELRDTLESQ